MRPFGEIAEKAARHRKFHWCRRPNGFSDMPIWRVVSQTLDMPLHQVLAFANRLEELGNAAANYGDVRGSLARFSAEEFAMALGMSAGDAARLYAELERPEIGWIAFDHVADFYDRNPDREDESAAERQRRKRLRDAIQKQLARLSRLGKIDERQRRAIEEVLGGTEVELRNLQAKLSAAELSTATPELSTGPHVTRDSRDMDNPDFSRPQKLSTVTRDSRMSQRDIVTVTPEQSRVVTAAAVDNSGDGPSGEKKGLPKEDEATAWLETEGRLLLIDRLQIRPQLAELYIERWRRDLRDDAALEKIIRAADGAGYIGARFHTLVTEQWRRHVARNMNGPQLPLMPPRPGQRKESA